MRQVNMDDHNLFSAVSYIQLLLCMSFIYLVTVRYAFSNEKNPLWKLQKAPFYSHGPSLLWAEFVMGRDCSGPSLLWAEMSRNRVTL